MPKSSALRQARTDALLYFIGRYTGGLCLDEMGWDSLKRAGYTRGEAQSIIDDLASSGKVEIRTEDRWVTVYVAELQEVSA